MQYAVCILYMLSKKSRKVNFSPKQNICSFYFYEGSLQPTSKPLRTDIFQKVENFNRTQASDKQNKRHKHKQATIKITFLTVLKHMANFQEEHAFRTDTLQNCLVAVFVVI